jgi:HK97 family phage portal protein
MQSIEDSHPLLLHNLSAKAAYSASDYLGATVRTLDGYGSKGAKPRPFNQQAAVRSFGGWVYKAAMLNANAVGRIPLRLYVKRRSTSQKLYRTSSVWGKRKAYLCGQNASVPSKRVALKVAEWDGNFEEVTEPHPALQTLARVNPWMNGFDLTVLRILYLLLTGNAFTHKVLDPVLKIPVQLWPMPSQHVSIKPSASNFIDGYVYGTAQDNQKFFPADEVIHSKLPNPKDPFYGMGCVEAAWTALGLHNSKRVMDQAKFDNMNRPDWFVAFKNGAKQDSLTRFENAVNEKFQGPSKSGKFLAIGADVTIQALNQEMEEIGDADRVVEEVAAAFGVPVSMLKASDPNRASAQTADTAWLRDTVRPLALSDEEKLNEQYLPDFDVGDEAFLAYDPVSFEDETTIRRNASAALSGGMLSVDEAREEIGYAPIGGPAGAMRFFPSGATGAGASLMGNMAPGQSDERTNENGVTPGGDLPDESSSKPPDPSDAAPATTSDDKGLDLVDLANATGIAIRGGLVTPQQSDEELMRRKLGLPPMGDAAKAAWEEDGGARRPITLAGNAPGSAPSSQAGEFSD